MYHSAAKIVRKLDLDPIVPSTYSYCASVNEYHAPNVPKYNILHTPA